MTDTLRMDQFPTVQLAATTGNITVPCELIAPGIAVTPYLELSDDGYGLGGGFRLTHTTSGLAFGAGQACIECARTAARRLAALDVDWASIDVLDKAAFAEALGVNHGEAIKALRAFGRCIQRVCAVGDGGELETCEACGFTGSHAPYCIQIVGPMVAGLNAAAEQVAR